MMQLSLFDMGPNFTNRTTKSVTFQGKLNLPIHRWYRLTPSFSPQLAEAGSPSVIHPIMRTDPFCLVDPRLELGPFANCIDLRNQHARAGLRLRRFDPGSAPEF